MQFSADTCVADGTSWSLSPHLGSVMDFILQSWQPFLVILARWMSRQRQDVIEYFRTENQVLKEKLGKKRIVLDDDQRSHLAEKAEGIDTDTLRQISVFDPAKLVAPDQGPIRPSIISVR